MKRLLSLLLAAIFVFSLAACSANINISNDGDDEEDETSAQTTEQAATDTAPAGGNVTTPSGEGSEVQPPAGQDPAKPAEKPLNGFLLKNKDVDLALCEPDTPLDPAAVYSSITYVPEMFYGDYRIRGGNDAQDKFAAEQDYFKWSLSGGELEYTQLPFRIQAGESMNHSITYAKEYKWMRVYFMRKLDYGECVLATEYCAYTVSGNKLTLRPLEDFNIDTENKKITYTFSNATWEYTFAFRGRELTLSLGDKSVTMQAGLDAYGEEDYFYSESYLSKGSKRIGEIDNISFRYDAEDNSSWISVEMVGEMWGYEAVGLIEENGLLTITYKKKTTDAVHTIQYVYFYCDEDGIILTDGVDFFYYNDTWAERNMNELEDFVSEETAGKLEDMSESQLEALVKKKDELLASLLIELRANNITVTINQETGELAIDSAILFGGDSAVLSDEGKALLDKFVRLYTSIIYSDKFDGFISKTYIEGHTAPIAGATYENSLELSQQRADNVKNYCLSVDVGEDTSRLASELEAVGLSLSRPIYKEDGSFDSFYF